MTSLEDTVELHLDALYERDTAGLIIRMRASHRSPPRVHLVRTVEGNRWLFAASLSPVTRVALDALLAAEPVVSLIEAMEYREPACRDALAVVLAFDAPPANEYRGPAFTFLSALPPLAQPVEVLATPEVARPHSDVAWLASFVDTDRPVFVARSEGLSVALCHSACIDPASVEACLDDLEAGFGAASRRQSRSTGPTRSARPAACRFTALGGGTRRHVPLRAASACSPTPRIGTSTERARWPRLAARNRPVRRSPSSNGGVWRGRLAQR